MFVRVLKKLFEFGAKLYVRSRAPTLEMSSSSTQLVQLNQIDFAIRILKMRLQEIMHNLHLDIRRRNSNQTEAMSQNQSNLIAYSFLHFCQLWPDNMIQQDSNIKTFCNSHGLGTDLIRPLRGFPTSPGNTEPDIIASHSEEFMISKNADSECMNCSPAILQGKKRAQPCGENTVSSQSRKAKSTRREN